MAKSDSIVNQGITIERHEFRVVYEGAPDKLIAEKICTADMLAELPKRVKDNIREAEDIDHFWNTRRIRGGRFRVTLHHHSCSRVDDKPRPSMRPPFIGHFTGSQEAYREAAKRYVIDFVTWFDGFISGRPETVAVPPFRFEDGARHKIKGSFYPIFEMLRMSRIEENPAAFATVAREADEVIRTASVAP
jgi:hypothetical protein